MALSKIQFGNTGRRNLVINGGMQVAQRGTSVTSVSASGVYRTVDRFYNDLGSSGTFTVSQATDAPTGFANSFKLDCTTADASPNYHLFIQKIEGQNLQQIAKGTSSAQPITLSFYVKSNKAGTYSVNARDRDNNRFCYKSYTINSANTWERKTVTFPADTTGALDNDNANSMDIEWWVAAGSTYNSGSTTGAWGANVNGNRAAANTVNIGTSTDDEWLITGVQLEVGSVASEFEHRSFGEELNLCHRYFYNGLTSNGSGTYSIFPVNFRNHVSTGNNGHIAFTVALPQPMRTIPTLTHDLANSNHAGNGVATGATTWNFYHQNQGWGSYAGNGNLNTLSRSGSTDSQVQLGTYYISPNSITYDQLTIGSSRKMHFSSEL